MERAINELEISLEIYENNAPIWEREGNVEQAKLCRDNADSIRAAITKLKE